MTASDPVGSDSNRSLSRAGGVLVAIGIAVMLAWIFGIDRLLSVLPDSDPMSFNTALCLIGLGTGFLRAERVRPSVVGDWILVAVVAAAALTFLEHTFNFDLGIDRLLWRWRLSAEQTHPGRMTAIESLAFATLGITLLMMMRGGARGAEGLIVALAGGMVASLAVVDVANRASELVAGANEVVGPQEPVHAALALLVAGWAMAAWGVRLIRARSPDRGTWIALAGGTALFLLGVVFNQRLRALERDQIGNTVETVSRAVRNRISAELSGRLQALADLAAVWRERSGAEHADWQTTALITLRQFPGARNVTLFDSTLAVVQSVGAAAPEVLLRRSDLEPSTPTGEAAESPAWFRHDLHNTRDGFDFVGIAPVTVLGRPVGYVQGVWGVRSVLSGPLGELNGGGFGTELSDGPSALFGPIGPEGQLRAQWSHVETVPFAGRLWSLSMWPSQYAVDFARSSAPIVSLAGGGIVALLLSLSLFFGQSAWQRATELERARRSLEGEMREREQAERALRETEQRLNQVRRLEAVARLAGGVAHQFNNLLTSIRGYAEIAATSLGRDSAVTGDLAEIERAAEQAGGLTGQLLAFSRQQVLKPEAIHLNEMLRELVPQIEAIAGEAITLRLELGPEIRTARADRARLTQVVIHLVENARDAMAAGGIMTIRSGDDDGEPAADPGAPPRSHYAWFEVVDSGPGMDAAAEAALFEPFAKSRTEASGLAMAEVHGVVAQSGGSIRVESALGVGTAIRVMLPQTSLRLSLPSAAPARRTDGPRRILVVDDETSVRELLGKVLAKAGYQVATAPNANEALRAVEAGLEPDAVVSDIIMPGMNGVELAGQLRERFPRLPILFVSGFVAENLDQRGFDIPGADFLPKPFRGRDLLAALTKLLDAGARVGESEGATNA